MRTSTFLAGATAAVLTGCVVTSVCPYYSEKDLVTEPAMVGSWSNTKNPGETWKFEKWTNFAYRLTLAEPSKTTVMEAHAFKLNGQLFLDIFSLEQDYHVIPAHYLLKVEQTAPTLKFSELDDGWLKSFLTNKPTAIAFHILNADDPAASRVVLTADTSSVQSFVVRHLDTPGAWRDACELRRESSAVETAQLKGAL